MAEILCGGTPTERDRQAVDAFASVLRQPTVHLKRVAVLRLDHSPEAVAAVAEHDSRPCAECGTS